MTGDLHKTKIIQSLCDIPREKRDANWQASLCQNIADARFVSRNPQVARGPDGFSYFQLELPAHVKRFDGYSIGEMKADVLLPEGYGVVLNASKGEPDWVFSYGDIVNYHLLGEFYTAAENWKLPAKEIITEEEEVLIGQPAESFLPAVARKALRNFLAEVGVIDTRILVMGRKLPTGTTQELVFNLTPDRFPTQSDFDSTMKRITWFLPRHYRYVCMREEGMEANFTLL